MREARNHTQYLREKLAANQGFLLILCVSLIEAILNIGRILPGDSYLYLGFANFFLGKGGFIRPSVAARPMVPLLAAALTLLLHNIYLSFGIVSGFFWISGAIVSYKLGQLILEDKTLATAAGLSYTTAPVLILTGAAVLTDSAGFFFIGLAIYLTLKRQRTNAVSSKTYFLDALVCGAGVLFRESVAFALLFMLSMRLLKKKGFLESLFAMFLVGIAWLVYLQLLGFGPDVLISKYSLSQKMATPESWGFMAYAGTFVAAFVTNLSLPRPLFVSPSFWIWVIGTSLYGVFVILGFIFSQRKKDLWTVLVFLFPSSVIWPEMSLRFSFFMWPAVIPSMISGMSAALSGLPSVTKAIPFKKELPIFFYVILLAIINTLSILAERGSLIIPRM